MEYLQKKDPRVRLDRLPFQGRNVVQYIAAVAWIPWSRVSGPSDMGSDLGYDSTRLAQILHTANPTRNTRAKA